MDPSSDLWSLDASNASDFRFASGANSETFYERCVFFQYLEQYTIICESKHIHISSG